MSRRLVLAASLFAASCWLPAHAAELTLEQILSVPFPSAMVASPRGDAVAWVFTDHGRRNLWVAQAPDWQGRAVTDYRDDDGQEIGQLSFSPDGQSLAFVRGGPPNSGGELPNPTSDPAGVERAIWLVSTDGKDEARKVADGSSPLWRADGQSLLFGSQGKIWQASTTEKDAGEDDSEPVELIGARGGLGNLRLSPDGARLALVSDRGTHSFIGVFDFEQQTLRYLDASLDRDFAPVWSPDGRQLAFVRAPARQAITIFGPQREGQPWSLRTVDVTTGEGREIWRAEEGRGSVFYGTEGDDALTWTRSDSLIFPWERDGWRHLYAVSASGGEARLLTPGFFEVEYVAADPGRDGVVFSSNQEDIDRRHLWRVDPAGGVPRALTSGSGIENIPVPLGAGAIAFVGATGTVPLQPRLVTAQGEIRNLAPAALDDFPVASLVEPEQVIFPASDGMRIHGQLFLPPSSFQGKRPGLLFFHGGSRRHMMLGFHYSSYYHNTYAFNQYMAVRGYVVLSVNYRSGIGYGLEFREAENYGAAGASELRDVLGAGLYLAARDDVDAEHVGLYGGSYGGYLTAMGLAHASELFAAGVDIHGVHDWRRTIKNFVPSYDPLENPEEARVAFESSPLAAVDGWSSPVLLIHGDDDRNVPFEESVVLVEQLRRLGVEHEVLVFPDEVHGFLRHATWLTLFGRAADFLDRHLAAAEQPAAAVSGAVKR